MIGIAIDRFRARDMTLLGIAIEGKKIAGVDEPVLSFFPGHADLHTPEKQRIHLHHLLTMSSGLAWTENTSNGR